MASVCPLELHGAANIVSMANMQLNMQLKRAQRKTSKSAPNLTSLLWAQLAHLTSASQREREGKGEREREEDRERKGDRERRKTFHSCRSLGI